jgi:hypothetical protein
MHHAASQSPIDPRIARALRGHLDALGWLPMWLVAMPASALWAAHRFALPHWPARAAREGGPRRRRRGVPQARRRDRAMVVPRRLKAA